MAKYEFKLPDIGEGIAEAEIVAWHVKVGDTIAEDQQIADMMTDKATVEMESPGGRKGRRACRRGRRPDPDRVGAGGDRDRRRGPRRRAAPARHGRSAARRRRRRTDARPGGRNSDRAVEAPSAAPAPAPHPSVEAEVAERRAGAEPMSSPRRRSARAPAISASTWRR